MRVLKILLGLDEAAIWDSTLFGAADLAAEAVKTLIKGRGISAGVSCIGLATLVILTKRFFGFCPSQGKPTSPAQWPFAYRPFGLQIEHSESFFILAICSGVYLGFFRKSRDPELGAPRDPELGADDRLDEGPGREPPDFVVHWRPLVNGFSFCAVTDNTSWTSDKAS